MPSHQQLIIPEDEHKIAFPSQVDSSMLSSFDACPLQFFRQYIERWSPSVTSIDLHAGGMVAAMLEEVRKHFYGEGLSLERSLLKGFARALEFWGDYTAPEGHPKTFENCVLAVYDYFNHYIPTSDPLKPYFMANGKPAIEFKFAIPTDVMNPETGEPILYCGRFDMLGEMYGSLFVVDEKTSRYAPRAEWIRQYGMRGQFLGYVWAAREYGYDVEGALVRMIVIQKTQFQHVAAPITLAQWQIERWHEEMEAKLQRMVKYWIDGHWPMSYGDACSSYSGCPYLDLCLQKEPRQWIGDYTKRYWDPLAQDPTAWPSEVPK